MFDGFQGVNQCAPSHWVSAFTLDPLCDNTFHSWSALVMIVVLDLCCFASRFIFQEKPAQLINVLRFNLFCDVSYISICHFEAYEVRKFWLLT